MKILIALAAVFITQIVFASEVKKFWAPVNGGKEVYVEYHAPAQGKPTIVLLHGLTYTTVQWREFIAELREFGYGIVCYDMQGMGKTLLKYAPIRATIPLTAQISDLHALLKNLKIKKPYNLLGLSYGGGVAFGYAIKHPELVSNLILFAPYTKPLKKVDDYLKKQVAITRLMNPFNPYTDRQVYEYYFRQFVYQTYPLQEPIVLENPYKLDAVYHMSFGIDTFIPEDHAAKLAVPAHLFIAEKDQYFPREEYDHFWSLFPTSTKKNLFVVKNSEHKIPEAQPYTAAKFVQSIFE
jgi:pimeloyl-ACP methyl ester carboxylesterase